MSRYVVCLARDIEGCEFLKIYRALDDATAHSHGLLRVVDESGEDYLYPRERFAELPLPADTAKTLDAAVAS